MSQVADHQIVPDTPQLAVQLARVDSLDLLRGLAILGIFVMNTWTMSMPQYAYTNPASYSPEWVLGFGFPTGNPDEWDSLRPLTGANYWTFAFIHLLADMKFITMFSMMFGAGIVLQSERSRAKGKNPWLIHYLRMLVLLAFGLCHTFGFWYGDILTDYAICGMLLVPLRLLPAGPLMFLGMLMVAMVPAIDYAEMHHWFPAFFGRLTTFENDMRAHFGAAGHDMYNDWELEVYRSGWWNQIVGHRFQASVLAHTSEFLKWTFWRCGGCILIGMALQRRKFFHGSWTGGAYATLATLATPVGWAIVIMGLQFNTFNGWKDSTGSLFDLWHLGMQFNYWGSLLCTTGYISFGVLVALWAAQRPALNLALVPLRSVGRMALTNYLSQTLIATTIFYGHGLGYFGKVSRFQLLPIVLVTWCVQLIASTLWLQHFRQGPLEWLWHSIVYWKWKSPLLPAHLRGRALTAEEPALT